MTHSEIRAAFFDYFTRHGHQRVLSSPLVPARDPTLLFTNAGMNQFKGVFLQEEKRGYRRAVTIQKCLRVSGKHNDFDEVGKTEFHHTFFEMLGNFSFGDYFKEKAIAYAWELLTGPYRLPAERLWITVFRDDDEAFRIWEKEIGVPAARIVRREKRTTSGRWATPAPAGPAPRSTTTAVPGSGPADFVDGNRRYVEIWNLVFMQFVRDPRGELQRLPAPSIDTGMGMERLTAILQNLPSNYASDLFRPLVEFTAGLARVEPQDPRFQVDLKVIADHGRALPFLIADGVVPANEGRGYVLRRILRRAVKHGRSLGLEGNFLGQVSGRVIELMKPFYPELEHHRDFIRRLLDAEEERFNRTLLNGLRLFEELVERCVARKEKVLPGPELFRSPTPTASPWTSPATWPMEKGLAIDVAGFQKELAGQKERSRLSQQEKRSQAQALPQIQRYASEFLGYETLEAEAKLLGDILGSKPRARGSGGNGSHPGFRPHPLLCRSRRPGGDSGSGKSENGFFSVRDCKKSESGTHPPFCPGRRRRPASGGYGPAGSGR